MSPAHIRQWFPVPGRATMLQISGRRSGTIELGPQCPIPAEEPLGLFALGNFSERVSIVARRSQQRKELPPWIASVRKLIDVNASNPWLQQLKTRLNRSVDQIRIVGIPANTYVLMRSRLDDSCSLWRIRRTAAVYLDPDLNPFRRSVLAQVVQRISEILNRGRNGHPFGKPHG